MLVGSAVVLIGYWIGAICAFLLGRYIFRESSEHLAQKYRVLKALERALKSDGLKVMILMRLSPIIPFIFVNYVLGVTSVTFTHYAVSTLFILPGTIVYVFIGTTTGSI